MTSPFWRVRQVLLVVLAISGGVAAGLSLHWGSRDVLELMRAYMDGQQVAEVRHRVNMAADGTWALLGLVITATSIGGLRRL